MQIEKTASAAAQPTGNQTPSQQTPDQQSQQAPATEGASAAAQPAKTTETKEENPGSPPSKETLKEKVKRLSRGEEKKTEEPEESPATKKSFERLEEKLSETEKKSEEYLKKLNKLDAIDETVSRTIQLQNAKANLKKLKEVYNNFDARFPPPFAGDYENGDDYRAAQKEWQTAKEEIGWQMIENDKIINPDRYKAEEPKKDPAFDADVASLEGLIPGIKEAAKIVDYMPDWQRDILDVLPLRMRSLVAHSFGVTFKPDQVQAMDKAQFNANVNYALDLIIKQNQQQPAKEDAVKAPPKIAEGALPPERRESLKERVAKTNGSFYHR